MKNSDFYKPNQTTYKNTRVAEISLSDHSKDRNVILRNKIVKKILNRNRKTETDTVLDSISGKRVQLHVDYPVIDGVMVYMTKRPRVGNLKNGIDYTTVVVKGTKYYVFTFSVDTLVFTTKYTRDDLEECLVMGRLYSKTAFFSSIGLNKKDKLGKFVVHSKSLYHNGSRITNFISKYSKIRRDWVSPDKVEEAPKRSWWSWW